MKTAAGFAFVMLAAAASAGLSEAEYFRLDSPDGRFVAVATFPRFEAWLPMFPGGGGDKPGKITVFTREGTRIGTADVPMVSLLYGIRWSAEAANIRGAAHCEGWLKCES